MAPHNEEEDFFQFILWNSYIFFLMSSKKEKYGCQYTQVTQTRQGNRVSFNPASKRNLQLLL